MKNFLKVDPNKTQKREKKLFSEHDCYEKLKPYSGGLAICHKPSMCEGLWKIVKPPKIGFSFSKQSCSEIFQMQLVYPRAG